MGQYNTKSLKDEVIDGSIKYQITERWVNWWVNKIPNHWKMSKLMGQYNTKSLKDDGVNSLKYLCKTSYLIIKIATIKEWLAGDDGEHRPCENWIRVWVCQN
jgi:hypothetical protein